MTIRRTASRRACGWSRRATSRASVTARYQPRLQLSGPRLSPDGTRVAFVEGVASDRATWPGGQPKVADLAVPMPGGALTPRDIGAGLRSAGSAGRTTARCSITPGPA